MNDTCAVDGQPYVRALLAVHLEACRLQKAKDALLSSENNLRPASSKTGYKVIPESYLQMQFPNSGASPVQSDLFSGIT